MTLGPNRIYWYCLLGMALWALLRSLGIDRAAPPVALGPFLLVLALAAVNLAARIRVARIRTEAGAGASPYTHLGWLCGAIDFLLIVAGLRFTGGLHSAVWAVAFVVVSGETVLERKREAVITRLGACVALGLGTLPLPPGPIDWPAYWLEMFVRMGFLLAVSSVVRRLRERSDTTKAEIANLRAELALAEERTRLSRDIHDGVGNSLAAAVLRLEAEARVREKKKGDEETAGLLREEAQALRQSMTAVRDWTFVNRPWPAPEGASASAVLTSEVERLARRMNLPIVVEGAQALDGLPEATRVAVLRIAQEGLTNAAKHASGATQVRAQIARGRGEFILVLHDDGAGFDPAAAGDGIGLASMRERAAGVGGTLTIESGAGSGTTITLRLPVR